MGKSSKKSDTKVVVAPGSLKAEKKGKNKREAEEALEKVLNVKKQKKNDGVAQAVLKEKVLAKTQKKKKEESSDSDDSSSEEEETVKVEAKKVVKPTKPPVKESSESESESEPESDQEPPAKGVVPAKKQQAALKNVSNGVPAKNLKADSSSSESSDDEDPKNKKMPAAKKVQVTKKVESSDSSEEDESSSDEEALPAAKKVLPIKKVESSDSSEEDESSSDEEAKIPPKAAAPKNVPAAAAKDKAASSDDSDSDSDDESSDEEKGIPANASLLKKVSAAAAKKIESSEDFDDTSESDETSSEDEGKTKSAIPAASKVPPKKGDEEDSLESESDDSDEDDAPAPKVTVGSKRPSSVTETKESSDDSEDDASEESEDEQHKNKKPKPAAKKESSSEEESSEDEEDSEDEGKKPSKTPKKNNADVEMVDAATPQTTTKQSDLKSANKTPKTPITPQSTGSKTLFVGNLSFQVERADVENFFKEAGEIADIRFALDGDERFRGFGHVEFTTAEAAQNALKLDGQSLLGRNVRLDLAREKGDRSSYTPYSKDGNSFQKGGKGQGQTVFVRGFDKSQAEDEIRGALQEHFGTCGDVRRVSIPTDYETGTIKGMAYVEFNDAGGFNKALELNGTEFGDQYLTVEEAKPRNDNREGRDNNSGRGRGRGSNSRGRGGRFDGGRGDRGGRGGRGGRGRGSFNKPGMTTAASGTKKTFGDDYE